MNESVPAENPVIRRDDLTQAHRDILDAMAQAEISPERALELFNAAKELVEAPWEHDEHYFDKKNIELSEGILSAVNGTLEVRREQIRVYSDNNRLMAELVERMSRPTGGLDWLTNTIVIAAALLYVAIEVLNYLRILHR